MTGVPEYVDPFSETAHRPYPLPTHAWVMAQAWHDLLFAHWPIDPDLVRATLPRGLELDTFDGRAWIGVVPFRMSGIRARGTPTLPWISAFPELNLRTYVKRDGRCGVWFYSLDAARLLAVKVARAWFHLPYFHARMSSRSDGKAIEYASERRHRGAPPASFRGRYEPTGPIALARAGSLEHWLTERYCLFSCDPRGVVRRGDIHHVPWPLQPATARIDACSLPKAHGFDLPDVAPHLLFVRRIDVCVWSPVRTVDL